VGAWAGEPRSICAIDAATGRLRWKQPLAVVPMTLAASRRGVFCMDRAQVVCLNPQTGEPAWRSADLPMVSVVPLSATPTLVLTDRVALVNCGGGPTPGEQSEADGDWQIFRQLVALSAEDGKRLWQCELPPHGYQAPKDILVADGLVWTGDVLREKQSGTWEGRDLLSGEVKRSHSPQWKKWFHQRCYRSRGTERFLMPSRTGVEMISPADGYVSVDHWVRGACLYGNIPANGLLYATPHPCGCFMEAMLHGYSALAPESAAEPPVTPDRERLWQSADVASAAEGPAADASAWPCYRHDNQRSSRSAADVPADLAVRWKSDVGGRLTVPIVAAGMLFVASADAHALHALDAETGRARWQRVIGGRIDSPPTYRQGRLFGGTRDGFIHCLRASDGVTMWRYQAAPRRQLVLANEQLESAWPVHGSVLVREDRVYAVAGRSAFLDGGMRFLVLDARTGRKIAEETIGRFDPQTSKDLLHGIAGCTMPPGNPDILSDDGQFLYMKSQRFDAQGRRPEVVSSSKYLNDQYGPGAHLFSAGDLLDGSGFHRVHMIYGKSYVGGHTSNHSAPKSAPSGVILAFDDSAVYGFGRQQQYHKWTRNLEFHVFSARKTGTPAARAGRRSGDKVFFNWSKPDPAVYATAIALAPRRLFLAGPPAITVSPYKSDEAAQEDLDRWQGRKGGKVVVYATADGALLAECPLPSPPVWDGMAAAGGKLYVSARDGRVYCVAGDRP
jgi:outer membrane protein assembly factor BamB